MFHVPEISRITTGMQRSTHADGNNGAFIVSGPMTKLLCIASDGEDWEHVSVSVSLTPSRIPAWREMQYVKDVFWDKEDCVVQFHPPENEYVNYHPGVLHLWRPTTAEMPTPPSWMVGPKEGAPHE